MLGNILRHVNFDSITEPGFVPTLYEKTGGDSDFRLRTLVEIAMNKFSMKHSIEVGQPLQGWDKDGM